MNKQEIEKAIELLTHCRKELECYLMCDNEIEVAIDALEKQILKRPIRHQPTYNFISCPVCNTDLIHTKNYCTYCGQAIDWRAKMNKQEIERAIKYWEEFKEEIPELKESHPDAGLDEQEECVDMAIFSLTQQLNNRWISCGERLPDKTDEYLCTVEWYGTSTKKQLIENNHIIEKRVINVYFLESISAFKEQDGFCTYEVIAWQPLPEAYREVLK